MEVDSSDDERSMDGEQQMESDDETEATQTKNLIAGKIVKIHLKNFLTHTEATVQPSEQLNLVSFCVNKINLISLQKYLNIRSG